MRRPCAGPSQTNWPRRPTSPELEVSISRLEASTRADISRLEAKIDTKSSELRAEIMKYMIAQTFVMIGVFFALLRLVR